MRKFLGLFLSFLLLGFSSALAQSDKPFAELDRYAKTGSGLFNHSDKTVSLFNAERKRLGANFENQLIGYLGGDVDKYYWISLYLSEKDYVQDNKPLPELALRIMQMGLEITQTHSDDVSVINIMGLNVNAAILSKKLKKNDLAKKYKAAAESLLGKDEYLGTFPALNDKDREIYDSIKT